MWVCLFIYLRYLGGGSHLKAEVKTEVLGAELSLMCTKYLQFNRHFIRKFIFYFIILFNNIS